MIEPTLNSDAQRAGWQFAAANPEQATRKQIADAAGVSTGTVGRWLQAWREELGDDLFRTEIAEQRAEQTAAARAASERMWDDLRLTEARNAGVTAGLVRQRLIEMLPSIETTRVDRGADGQQSAVVVKGPSATAVDQLARAYERLLAGAELLIGRPTKHTQRSVPSDQWSPPALPAGVMSDDEKRAKVIDLRDRARRKASGE